MKAFLKNYRQSPRKVRLVADMVRGKSIAEARVLLDNTPKRATVQLRKLVDSAVANATHNDAVKEDGLFIKEIRVDEGFTIKRIRPVSRGAAHPIRKRTSRVMLTLGGAAAEAQKSVPKEKAQTTTKKVATKKAPAKKAARKKVPAKKVAAAKTTSKKAAPKKTATKKAKK